MVLASHLRVFHCFMTLHMMRTSNGWSPNPITLDDIESYERRFGKMPIDDDLMVRLIKQCDETALAWLRKKQDKAKPAGT